MKSPTDAKLLALASRLTTVRDLVAMKVEAEAELVKAVAAARADGLGWTEITEAFGGTMTRQGIQKRYKVVAA